MSFKRPKFINEWMDIKKQGGLKLLFQKKGWQVILAVAIFYLIRDTILYIVIPYIGFTSLRGCF
tara:strand:+ start:333 stop:524 length:192 start_codon:yes stop_codon:yes gene_type:complete